MITKIKSMKGLIISLRAKGFSVREHSNNSVIIYEESLNFEKMKEQLTVMYITIPRLQYIEVHKCGTNWYYIDVLFYN